MKHIVMVSLLLLLFSWANSSSVQEDFMHCMSTQFSEYTRSLEIIFNQDCSLYSCILQSTVQNPRYLNATTPKPLLIITPFHKAEIQAAFFCSQKHELQIRVRSGGHDYEGLSYLCQTPFIIIDLSNMRSMEINLEVETARVGAIWGNTR